jgi:ligand-binding sensor protein
MALNRVTASPVPPAIPEPAHRIPERLFPPDQHFVQLQPTTSKAEEIEFTAPELLEFMDVQTIQSLMNDFYDIVNMPMAIVDIKGKVLAGVGWQRICLDFHRVNPDSCRNCMESDTKLTVGIRPGEYRLYKCRNNMWDFATPLMVGERHVGNIFSGQFFFDDEAIDREYFVQQAKHYGFAEQQYLNALEAVPRLSRKTVERATAFMMKLAHILSEMGYSNLKMAQWMSERRQAEEALIRSEKLASVGRLAATVAHEFLYPRA